MSFFSLTEQDNTESLFDRLRGSDTTQDRKTDQRAVQADSIRCHLLNLLNTRKGNCRSTPALGMADLNDVSQSEANIYSGLCESIRQCISQYEPRLCQVSVTADYDDARLEMILQITGMVKPESLGQKVLFRVITHDHQRYLMQ